MRALVRRRPGAFAIAITGVLVTLVLAGRVVAAGLPSAPRLLLTAAVGTIELVGAIAIVSALGWWREVGFTRPAEWRRPWAAALLLLPVGIGLGDLIHAGTRAPLWIALLLAGLALGVGFTEETYFRGLVLKALVTRGSLAAVIASAALFGLAHVTNLFAPGAAPGAVAFQVTVAGLVGVVLASVRLLMNAIWPVILAHALIDFAGFLILYPRITLIEPPIQAVVLAVVVYGGLALGGLVLVRRLPPS